MESINISGEIRTDLGKKAAKQDRRKDMTPCVIYGGDKVVHFSAPKKSFKHLIYTRDFKLAEIAVDGQSYKCILKDAQFHPVTDELLHIDFLNLIPGKTLKANIPVRFKGASPGVKVGGKLVQKLRYIKVKTTPEKLVDELLFDISELELGGSTRVRDLEAIDGIEVMNSPGIPVASVEIPRSLKSAAAASDKAAAGGAAATEKAS